MLPRKRRHNDVAQALTPGPSPKRRGEAYYDTAFAHAMTIMAAINSRMAA